MFYRVLQQTVHLKTSQQTFLRLIQQSIATVAHKGKKPNVMNIYFNSYEDQNHSYLFHFSQPPRYENYKWSWNYYKKLQWNLDFMLNLKFTLKSLTTKLRFAKWSVSNLTLYLDFTLHSLLTNNFIKYRLDYLILTTPFYFVASQSPPPRSTSLTTNSPPASWAPVPPPPPPQPPPPPRPRPSLPPPRLRRPRGAWWRPPPSIWPIWWWWRSQRMRISSRRIWFIIWAWRMGWLRPSLHR